MIWSVVMQIFSTLLELIRIGRLCDQEKDLEILVLRKQLAMVERQLDKPVRLSRIVASAEPSFAILLLLYGLIGRWKSPLF